MDEDEDDFLYGGDAGAKKESVDGKSNGQIEEIVVPEAHEEAGFQEQEEEEEEEDDDEEQDMEDDSDSDLEIIVDGSVGAGPPVGYNARPPAAPPIRPTPFIRPPPSIMTSDYTPNARPGQAPSANSLAILASLEGNTTDHKVKNAIGNDDDLQLPEGGPPPVPITAPRLDLDPSDQSLMLPPDTVDGEPGPLIYHVDPTEFEEKPWRRPGADLTDWFNYGFNEESWKLWGEKKHKRTVERIDMETNGVRHDSDNNADVEHVEQTDGDNQSVYNSQIPSQQLQAMQAMMGASGMSMPPEQMMAFMGLGQGAMPGMGMMGMQGMSGMPGMGSMYGQQIGNQGVFPGAFGAMPNMQMMSQPFQRGPHGLPMRPADSMVSVEEEAVNGAGEQKQSNTEMNGNAVDATNDMIAQAPNMTTQVATVEQLADEGSGNIPQGPSASRGVGVLGAPTGPARSGSNAKGPSAPLPSSIPTGPKNPGRRYNDRDTGMGLADSLDYGAGQGNAYRDDSGRTTRSRSPERKKASRSRDASTDRDRDYDRERERERGGRDRDDGEGRTSIRIKRDRTTTGERHRHSSPDDELEKLSKRNPSSRRTDARKPASNSQKYNSTNRRDERRRSGSTEKEDDWDRESIESSASRRRSGGTSSRQQTTTTTTSASGRTSTRSERRRGDHDSGSETERERKYGRSQARAERRAGRDGDDSSKATSSSRKRGAPEEDASPMRSSSSRKRR